jgi:hypothetical protein
MDLLRRAAARERVGEQENGTGTTADVKRNSPMLAGPRPESLVPVEDLDRVLGAEAVAALVAAAKIPDGPLPFGAGSTSRREWFARAVRGSVRTSTGRARPTPRR